MYNFKFLFYKYLQKSGRNNLGKITCKHRGGTYIKNKLIYFNLDYWYSNHSFDSTLSVILNNFIHKHTNKIISLIMFIDGILKGKKRFIICTNSTIKGDIINFTNKFPLKLGSVRSINNFILGSYIHSVEFKPKTKVSLSRSMGTYCTIIKKFFTYTCLKMPSGKFKLISNKCFGVLGKVSYIKCKNITLAGQIRHLGKRPIVRGVAMNSVDHPHGGGTGKTSIGLKYSKSIYGFCNKGIKTRCKNKFIIK